MTDPAPSPNAAQPPIPVRPMPSLGRGGRWSGHPGIDGVVPAAEPYHRPARPRPAGWAKTGDVGASAPLRSDEEPVTVEARAYDGEPDLAEARRRLFALFAEEPCAPADLYTVNPDAGMPSTATGLTVLRAEPSMLRPATYQPTEAEIAEFKAALERAITGGTALVHAARDARPPSFRRRVWRALTRQRTT